MELTHSGPATMVTGGELVADVRPQGGAAMLIYHGTVKNGVIVLQEGVTLTEGSTVEVHVLDAASEAVLTQVASTLAGMGVRVETKPPTADISESLDRTPIHTTG